MQHRIAVKNTFIEVMAPVAEPTQRALTTPADMGGDSGASSSFDHQNQQLSQQQFQPQHQLNQQRNQQQTGDARNQMHMNQSPQAYIDPNTGVLQNFGGMPVQMVQMVPYMAPNQEGYPNVQFVDPSAFANASDASMQSYDFSQAHAQGAWVMPMNYAAQFVQMNPAQMQMMEVPASPNEQSSKNNFEAPQYHQGHMNQSHHTMANNNMKEKRPMGQNKGKQKEVQSSNVIEGPKAVLVDLSRLRPVNKATGSQNWSSQASWYQHF
jgi:hypothetical protein